MLTYKNQRDIIGDNIQSARENRKNLRGVEIKMIIVLIEIGVMREKC